MLFVKEKIDIKNEVVMTMCENTVNLAIIMLEKDICLLWKKPDVVMSIVL